MINDTCPCGAEFDVKSPNRNGALAAIDERYIHLQWLNAHASCRLAGSITRSTGSSGDEGGC